MTIVMIKMTSTNTYFQHKIQLMYVSIMCAQIGSKDNIQLVSVSLFYYCNNIKNIEK